MAIMAITTAKIRSPHAELDRFTSQPPPRPQDVSGRQPRSKSNVRNGSCRVIGPMPESRHWTAGSETDFAEVVSGWEAALNTFLPQTAVNGHPRNIVGLGHGGYRDSFLDHRPNAVTVYAPTATSVRALADRQRLI